MPSHQTSLGFARDLLRTVAEGNFHYKPIEAAAVIVAGAAIGAAEALHRIANEYERRNS